MTVPIPGPGDFQVTCPACHQYVQVFTHHADVRFNRFTGQLDVEVNAEGPHRCHRTPS